MKNPDDFPKALYVANGVTVSMYTVIGAVCYALDGQLVDSPVLNALAGAARKVAYGLAIPTIIIAGVIPCSVLAKQCMKLVYRENGLVDEERLNSSRKKPGFYSTILYDTMWCFCILVAWIIALGLANVIPFFNDLLALIGSLVGTWLCLGFPAMFGLYLLYDGVETSSPAPPTSPGSKTRRQTQRALEVWKTWSAKKRFYLGSYLFLLTACIVLVGSASALSPNPLFPTDSDFGLTDLGRADGSRALGQCHGDQTKGPRRWPSQLPSFSMQDHSKRWHRERTEPQQYWCFHGPGTARAGYRDVRRLM